MRTLRAFFRGSYLSFTLSAALFAAAMVLAPSAHAQTPPRPTGNEPLDIRDIPDRYLTPEGLRQKKEKNQAPKPAAPPRPSAEDIKDIPNEFLTPEGRRIKEAPKPAPKPVSPPRPSAEDIKDIPNEFLTPEGRRIKEKKKPDQGGGGGDTGGTGGTGPAGGSGPQSGDPGVTASAQDIVAASRTTIPASNSDIGAIAQEARAILAASNACGKAECPIVKDCATAAALFQALIDAETYLDAALSALNKAAADSAAAHNNVVAQTRITSTNLSIAQEALGVKEYLYRLATMLFDLASLSDDFKNMAESGTGLPGENLAHKLDTMYETLKDAESLAGDSVNAATDAANHMTGGNQTAPGMPLSGATGSALGVNDTTMSQLNDLKSNLSDAANAFDAARKELAKGAKGANPKDLVGGLANAAGKIAFRDLKVAVEKQIAELQKQIEDLIRNLSEEEKVLAGLFEERARIGTRRNGVEETLAAVRSAKDSLQACLARTCGLPTVSRPTLPDFYSPPSGLSLGARKGFVGWGNALRELNGRFVQVGAALKARFTVIDYCPPKESFTTPQPPQPPEDGPSGGIPPHNVVETNCPACRSIALALARVLDEIEFLRSEIEAIEKATAQLGTLKSRLTQAQRELAVQDGYIRALLDIIRNAQIGSAQGAGFNLAGQAMQDLALAQAGRVEIRGRISYYEREIARLESALTRLSGMKAHLEELNYTRRNLRSQLADCEKKMCKVTLDRVVNVIGNNPFYPLNPLGPGVTGPTFGVCPTPQPPDETQSLPCPPGQTGSITQMRNYRCMSGTWFASAWFSTGNTCTTAPPPGCTTPQPVAESQTLPCPAGQTGTIVQMRTYTCVGTAWVAGPWTTTSSTCVAPPSGCATNYSTGNYICSGQCGIGSTGLTVTSGSNSMTANPFGANMNVVFNCLGGNATSQSNNLIILNQPGHTCGLNGFGASFGIMCRNTGGGSCASTCSR